MKITLSRETAKAIFDDLSSQPELSSAYKDLIEQLRPLCSINLEWHPHGSKGLPTINGVGWAVMFSEHPSDSDEPETSLWDLESDRCYLLTGDHRGAYSLVANYGFSALKEAYDILKANPRFRHECSADAP